MKGWFVGSALLWLACAAHAQGTVKDRMTVAPATPSAEAQDAAAPEGERACNTDAEKFCSQGGGPVARCLREHQNDISAACYDARKVRRGNGQCMQALS